MNLTRDGKAVTTPSAALQVGRSGSKVLVNFTEPVDGLVMTAEEARKLAEALNRLAVETETRNK